VDLYLNTLRRVVFNEMLSEDGLYHAYCALGSIAFCFTGGRSVVFDYYSFPSIQLNAVADDYVARQEPYVALAIASERAVRASLSEHFDGFFYLAIIAGGEVHELADDDVLDAERLATNWMRVAGATARATRATDNFDGFAEHWSKNKVT